MAKGAPHSRKMLGHGILVSRKALTVWQNETMIIAGAAKVLACCENSEPILSSRNMVPSAATNARPIITSNVNLAYTPSACESVFRQWMLRCGHAPSVARARLAARL